MVNVSVKWRDSITSGRDWRDERKRISEDASKVQTDDIKTGVDAVLWEECGSDLLTDHTMSGVKET